MYRSRPLDPPLLVVSTQVVALHRDSGLTLWEYALGAPARRFAIDGERLFVFDADGNLHCLDVATGTLIGRIDLELRTANNMLVDGERLYVSDDYQVVALTRDGRVLWRSVITANGGFSLCGLGIAGGNIVQPDFSTS